MNIKDIPDPNIDWDEQINYNDYSDYNRPEPGFKRCPKCHILKAVNRLEFC